MMKRDVFDFRREAKVLKKDLYGLAGSRLSTCLIIAGIFLVLEVARLFVFGEAPAADARVQGICTFLCFFMMYLPTMMYGDVTDADRGVFYPLLPASSFEKYISMLLCCVVIVPVMFFLSLAVIDVFVLILKCGRNVELTEFFKALFLGDGIRNIGFYICIQSIFIAGNLHFRRNAFVKSFFLTVASLIVYAAVKMITFGRYMMESTASQIQEIQESDGAGETLILWSITVLLWIFSYMRFKRLEYS